MRVFGIDPGLANTGYAIIEVLNENSLNVLKADNFITKKGPIEERLNKIFLFLKETANQYLPNYFAIEKVYFNTNLKTAMMIEEVRGVILLLSSQLNVPIYQYTPLEVKKTLTQYGKASKFEVKRVVEQMLNTELPKSDDACDAVAVAVCHFLIFDER